MELYLAGGVGEHGRNCFFAEGKDTRFLVDCGRSADTPEDPYPHLSPEKIRRADALFLTHSHADHTGAIPWLLESGFRGQVIASEETLRQLPFGVRNSLSLETLCPDGVGNFRGIGIRFGRSGHCAGGVWYRFAEGEKSLLFSGDYTENSLVYRCDPIRAQHADVAVLDCAYGKDTTAFSEACERLVRQTKQLLATRGILLFPVPKYGRGPEILKLLAPRLPDVPFYGDPLFLENPERQKVSDFWHLSETPPATVRPYAGETEGIVFVSDPQLRTGAARKTVGRILSVGGMAIMTGTPERGSVSARLLAEGGMYLYRYPVHQNYEEFCRLCAKNLFRIAIPYHSPEFSEKERIRF